MSTNSGAFGRKHKALCVLSSDCLVVVRSCCVVDHYASPQDLVLNCAYVMRLEWRSLQLNLPCRHTRFLKDC